jgi:hypothetical protein
VSLLRLVAAIVVGLALLAVAAPAPAGAQSGGTIAGTVRNGTTAQPAAGAAVQLVFIGAAGPQAVGETRSDSSGRFAFRGLPDGRYLVTARHQGVSYAAHAVISGGAAQELVVHVFDASAGVSLLATLLGMAVEAYPGYVRVSEVVHLQNPEARTFLGDVVLALPRGARYVVFGDGFHQPRAEGARITDRLIVRPGAHQLSYAYSVAGAGEVALDRSLSFPVDRLEVFVAAPAEARSPRLQPLPAATEDGRTYTRATGRALPPGDLAIAVVGVPAHRWWRAPAAAVLLAGVLIVGLLAAAARAGRDWPRGVEP